MFLELIVLFDRDQPLLSNQTEYTFSSEEGSRSSSQNKVLSF
jgi:hypothetical protein